MNKRFVLAIASRTAVTHPRVINLGFRNNMPALYAAADAAILASKYEPFGLVGPEAVLCGTPVILANTVGATEVIAEPACTRFQLTPESLTDALEKFLKMQKSEPLIITTPDLRSVIHHTGIKSSTAPAASFNQQIRISLYETF